MRWSAVSMAGGDGNAYPRKRFLADMTTRRATPPIVLSTRFHGYVGGYNIFHAMRQVLKLSREPRYTVFIATELIRR